jgi:hypothetical protein
MGNLGLGTGRIAESPFSAQLPHARPAARARIDVCQNRMDALRLASVIDAEGMAIDTTTHWLGEIGNVRCV